MSTSLGGYNQSSSSNNINHNIDHGHHHHGHLLQAPAPKSSSIMAAAAAAMLPVQPPTAAPQTVASANGGSTIVGIHRPFFNFPPPNNHNSSSATPPHPHDQSPMSLESVLPHHATSSSFSVPSPKRLRSGGNQFHQDPNMEYSTEATGADQKPLLYGPYDGSDECMEDEMNGLDDGMAQACHGFGGGDKKGRRLGYEQVKALEKAFEVENRLEPERKVWLAGQLGLQPRQVAVWFQNRRARWKTKQMERDYGVLKSKFEALKADRDKLLLEKETLKAELARLKDFEKGEQPSTQSASDDQISSPPTLASCSIVDEGTAHRALNNTIFGTEGRTPPAVAPMAVAANTQPATTTDHGLPSKGIAIRRHEQRSENESLSSTDEYSDDGGAIVDSSANNARSTMNAMQGQANSMKGLINEEDQLDLFNNHWRPLASSQLVYRPIVKNEEMWEDEVVGAQHTDTAAPAGAGFNLSLDWYWSQ